MNDYTPLSLRKSTATGNRYGTLNLYGETFTVMVSNPSGDNRHYLVDVVNHEGSLVGPSARPAGLLTRSGSITRVQSYDANSKPEGDGYIERGTLDANAERVVAEFLAARRYAAQEDAKTPEQRMAEQQARREARREAIQARQRAEISGTAQEMLDTLESLVPQTTTHYAVEDARRALVSLIGKVDTIKTRGE